MIAAFVFAIIVPIVGWAIYEARRYWRRAWACWVIVASPRGVHEIDITLEFDD